MGRRRRTVATLQLPAEVGDVRQLLAMIDSGWEGVRLEVDGVGPAQLVITASRRIPPPAPPALVPVWGPTPTPPASPDDGDGLTYAPAEAARQAEADRLEREAQAAP